MPRLPRIHIKGALNFITCRGEHNETLFKDEKDFLMFLELMKRYQEQYGIKLFAYCLMPEHLHLLLEMDKSGEQQETGKTQGLSAFMRDLNNNYTKYYNSRYDRKGHLFRERFKSALIEKESHLLKMTAYIHLNPEKLGLVKDAKDYRYSTYQTYLYNERCTEGELDSLHRAVSEALSLMQGTNYEEFVKGLQQEEAARIHRKLRHGGILGTEEFVKMVKAEVEAYQAKGMVEKAETSDSNGYRLYLLFGSLFLILVIGAAGSFLFFFKRERPQQKTPEFTIKAAIASAEDLKATEWQIQVSASGQDKPAADTITFTDGKFVSANLNALGFPGSNYSLSIEDSGRIVWETMQTADDGGVASWHGEIELGKMRGIISLRQPGKEPQDFSFISVSYRRRKQ